MGYCSVTGTHTQINNDWPESPTGACADQGPTRRRQNPLQPARSRHSDAIWPPGTRYDKQYRIHPYPAGYFTYLYTQLHFVVTCTSNYRSSYYVKNILQLRIENFHRKELTEFQTVPSLPFWLCCQCFPPPIDIRDSIWQGSWKLLRSPGTW